MFWNRIGVPSAPYSHLSTLLWEQVKNVRMAVTPRPWSSLINSFVLDRKSYRPGFFTLNKARHSGVRITILRGALSPIRVKKTGRSPSEIELLVLCLNYRNHSGNGSSSSETVECAPKRLQLFPQEGFRGNHGESARR